MTDETTRDDDAASGAPGTDGTEARELRLSRLDDYEVEEGYPDIRGWPVRGSNGLEVGVVGELLVDTDLLEVAAVDVHLGVGAAGVRGNMIGSTRVPIEAVRIQSDKYVVVDVGVIPCEDILQVMDASGTAVRRVPCGQIGIRRRTENRGLPPDVEVERRRGSDGAEQSSTSTAAPDRGDAGASREEPRPEA